MHLCRIPGPHAGDFFLLKHLQRAMGDLEWTTSQDDYNAPQLVGRHPEGEMRLSTRNREWVINWATPAGLQDACARLLAGLALLTAQEFATCSGEIKHLVCILNNLTWVGCVSGAAEGKPRLACVTLGGKLWLALFSADAEAETMAAPRTAVTWGLVEYCLRSMPEVAGVLINPFGSSMELTRETGNYISSMGHSLRLQRELGWGWTDRDVTLWNWSERQMWLRALALVNLDAPSKDHAIAILQLATWDNNCCETVEFLLRNLKAGPHSAINIMNAFGCTRRFSPGEIALLLEAPDARRDFVSATNLQMLYGNEVPITDKVLPRGLQLRLGATGAEAMRLVETKKGLCFEIACQKAEVADPLFAARLAYWLKPYHKFFLTTSKLATGQYLDLKA